MTPEKFEQLVSVLDDAARAHPASYRARVLLLSLVGYAYVGAILLLLLLLLAGAALSILRLHFLGAKLLLVLAPFIWLIVRALWLKMEAPEGIEVDARQSPALFAEIEGLRRALRAPR